MGRLTTHVLDMARGGPAAGLAFALFRLGDDAAAELLVSGHTNADGRAEGPLLEGPALAVGRYQLVFQAGDYLRGQAAALSDPPFLDDVVIRFGIGAVDEHYHVPLLLSPYGYSTYRGS
jgi:5-hydroxyisourate hydrolase